MIHYPNWPKKGEKMVFKGAGKFHFFTNVIENAKSLRVGDVFTVSKCEPASSWCPIYFEETGDLTLEAAWFERLINPFEKELPAYQKAAEESAKMTDDEAEYDWNVVKNESKKDL